MNSILRRTKMEFNTLKSLVTLGTPPDVFAVHLEQIKSIVPPLTHDLHKGEAGRIGVIGGSLEYTGAPYFAAMSSLLVGADLVHVFCASAAAPVIKSYSPELIVHPVLDHENAVEEIEQWLARLHVLIIGPGLGRDARTLERVAQIITRCKTLQKPLIIDADGLFLITDQLDLVKDYNGVILTPNVAEFQRLFGGSDDAILRMREMSEGVTILEKGRTDRIWNAATGQVLVECPEGGSKRRCGGQGDMLCGSIATFYWWALKANMSSSQAARLACLAASFLTKECSRKAFAKQGRAMVTSDMIKEISTVFKDNFVTNTGIYF